MINYLPGILPFSLTAKRQSSPWNRAPLPQRPLYNCRLSLMEMTEQFNIHLCWVPGHRGIPGNYRADELARQGTTLRILPDRQSLGMPLATCKHLLKLNAISKTNLRWENGSTCYISRQIWAMVDHKCSAELVETKAFTDQLRCRCSYWTLSYRPTCQKTWPLF